MYYLFKAPNMQNLQYPIGKFIAPTTFASADLSNYISIIESFPDLIKNLTAGLTESQLETPYRPEGWTIRQVVHHCADSHMNSIIRFKLALTEDKPTVKAYQEAEWANLNDSKTANIDASLKIIEGVHQRWVIILKSMSDSDFNKTFIHPVSGKEVALQTATALYAWHCEHHLAHINLALMHRGQL